MQTAILRGVMAGVLLGFMHGATPVRAQITVEPASLSVDVEQHETVIRTVSLTNTGSEALTFCVSFDRPLQRNGSALRLSERVGAAPCGEYGEILYRYDEDDFENDTGSGLPRLNGVTMTPEGRLFTHESGGLNRTLELTPDLRLVRLFEHPHVADLTPFNGTPGITYDTESGTLWWLNTERHSVNGQITTFRVLLLEGDFNGEETGLRIEIAPSDTPLEDFGVRGLSYDRALDVFFFLGISDMDNVHNTSALWAVDRAGTLAEGYPLRPEPYPPPVLIGAPDVHGGAEGRDDGVRVEYGAYPEGALGYDRIAVVDRWGNDQGEVLETPVPDELFEHAGWGINGNPLRSRVDPNGVMYMTFANFENRGIVGVRPHPLPPSWLVVDSDAGPEAAWDGTLAPGESRALELTFRAGAREVGEYTSALQVFEAATGEAVEVPLTLTVTPGVDAEEGAEPQETLGLAVYPNPSRGTATVSLTLDAASEVRVVVYDVLGREVVVLQEGSLNAGRHALSFDAAGLPAGVYVVRVTAGDRVATEQITVIR